MIAGVVPVGHRPCAFQDIRAVTLLRHMLSVQLLICSLLLSVGVSLPAAGSNSIERQSGDTLERLVSTQLAISPGARAVLSGMPGDADPEDNPATLNQSALSYLRNATAGFPAATVNRGGRKLSPHQARAPPIR